MKIHSPLRYPGGKGKLANFMKQVFRDNLLCGGYYVEPYAGGASVALSLLFSGCASNIVINDIDKSIYAFWHSVIHQTEAFCELVSKAKMDVPTWRKHQEIQRGKRKSSLLELGFSTFYLNRTNRSGILRGGLIGGLKQLGAWKMDARFNKVDLINRIRQIGSYRDRISTFNLDACELIRKVTKSLSKTIFFYLDPPYFHKGQDLYVNHYQPKDHKAVAETITGLKSHQWVVSYDYTPEITKLYRRYPKYRYSINYSACQYGEGDEVMFFSDNLVVPTSKNLA